MRLTRRPPPIVAFVVWAVAFACLVYGTLSHSAMSIPAPEAVEEGATTHEVDREHTASTSDSL